jgi:hypothetical protein
MRVSRKRGLKRQKPLRFEGGRRCRKSRTAQRANFHAVVAKADTYLGVFDGRYRTSAVAAPIM